MCDQRLNPFFIRSGSVRALKIRLATSGGLNPFFIRSGSVQLRIFPPFRSVSCAGG